jgi:hypothetical protein
VSASWPLLHSASGLGKEELDAWSATAGISAGMLFPPRRGNNLYRLRIGTLAHFGILVGVSRNLAGRASTGPRRRSVTLVSQICTGNGPDQRPAVRPSAPDRCATRKAASIAGSKAGWAVRVSEYSFNADASSSFCSSVRAVLYV